MTHHDEGVPCGPVRVTFEHVWYVVDSKKPHSAEQAAGLDILRGVTGEFAPFEMCGMLGPSGSGKTTFLDLLAGRKNTGRVQGTILYGGVQPTMELLRSCVGYVEQYNTLVDTMTVCEMLMYTAALKRPRDESNASKRAAVEALLSRLSLESCRDTRIGSALSRGISGGQAKRVNIAAALITDAKVLLLDEPTTGLDSFTANEVMKVVKSLCKDGTTVATTIHSPTSVCFGLFDRLLVLAGGRMVYYGGSGREVVNYYVNECGARQPTVGDNLAEWIMEFTAAEARQPGGCDALADLYAESHLAKRTAVDVHDTICCSHEYPFNNLNLRRPELQPAQGPSRCLEGGGSQACPPIVWSFLALLRHRSLSNFRSPEYVLSHLYHKAVLGAIFTSLYWRLGKDFTVGNIPNVVGLLFITMSREAQTAMGSVDVIIFDRPLYFRELHDGMYRPSVYFLWRLADEMTLQLLFAWVTGSFVYFHLAITVTTMTVVAMSFALASLTSSNSIAFTAVRSIIVCLVAFAGFMLRKATTPFWLRWTLSINVMHHVWGGMMVNQFGEASGASVGGTRVLEFYGLTGVSKWIYLGFASISFAVWVLFAWVAFVFCSIKQRRR